jgi:hypothetical protein
MDAYLDKTLGEEREVIGEVDISSHISDHDPIHNYNDGYDSDTSDEGSQSDEEEFYELDEDEYAIFKKRMNIKRGRSIGLSFKPNGYLILNRQLAYLLRARKLVLYGPFRPDDLNAPLGERNFCPSLQDVFWRLSGLKFCSNGQATLSIQKLELEKALSLASIRKYRNNYVSNSNSSMEYLRRLGIAFDSNGAIIKNATFKALLATGEIVVDNSKHGDTLPNSSKSTDGSNFFEVARADKNEFRDRYAKPSMVFSVSRPTSEIALGFDQKQKKSTRNLQKGLSKSKKARERREDGIISGISSIPVKNNDLENLGSTRFIISLSDLIFAMEDEKKLLSSRSVNNNDPEMSIDSIIFTHQKNDRCNYLRRKGQNSVINSKIETSEFSTQKQGFTTNSEPDLNILKYASSVAADNLLRNFKTTIKQARRRGRDGAQPKFLSSHSPFAYPRSTISLPPWKSIKFTYTSGARICGRIRNVDKVLIKVNERALLIIDLFRESSTILGGSKKLYLPLVFRCWFRAMIVA